MFTTEEVLVILDNVGIDTTCGECMSIAFTGTSSAAHTCSKQKSSEPSSSSECPDEVNLFAENLVRAMEAIAKRNESKFVAVDLWTGSLLDSDDSEEVLSERLKKSHAGRMCYITIVEGVKNF